MVWGLNSGGGEIFHTCPDRPWGPPSLLYNGYWVFPGVKSGQSVTLTPHPFQRHGQERVELYLYTSYGLYGLYRASVPVQGCTLPSYFLVDADSIPGVLIIMTPHQTTKTQIYIYHCNLQIFMVCTGTTLPYFITLTISYESPSYSLLFTSFQQSQICNFVCIYNHEWASVHILFYQMSLSTLVN